MLRRWCEARRSVLLGIWGGLVVGCAAALSFSGYVGPAAIVALAGALVCVASLRGGERLFDEADRRRTLSELHFATIEALALAIDAKDKTTASHIRRVQYYAEALARAAGLPDDEVRGVTTAALLHDIGKLAIPEHILTKPGRLTDEEFQKIRIHPQVGFEIIEHVPFPYPVAPLVLCHHERWDGKGYPLGLRAEDIPLGARVLAVADYFDSVTRDRPYHKRVGREFAKVLLRQEATRALDPELVAKFLEILPGLCEYEAAAVAAPHREAAGALSVGPALADRPPETGEGFAFDNIANAHHEIYALYELAQAIGSTLDVADTMALIADKLSPLVPFSCFALFVHDEDEMLRCRFATGVDAGDIRDLAVPFGHGLTGWVARNRRSIVGGRPVADFEHVSGAAAAVHLNSVLSSPLVSDDRVVGTLAVYHVEPDFYSDEHRRLLDRVSEQAAPAISNSIVFEQTRQASLSDPLTGLPNSRFMLGYLGRELSRAERLDRSVAILVLDLDDFKKINDTFGHAVGDRALREVGRVLRDTVRPYDICVRYAGDEFIIVLPDCDAADAEARRVQLQDAVDAVVFEAGPGQAVRLHLSIGAAVFPTDGTTYETLLVTADGRMYRDKRARKKREPVTAARSTEAVYSDEVGGDLTETAVPTHVN